LQYNTVKFTK